MTELWIALGLCAVFIGSAAIPLLKERQSRKFGQRPAAPRRETLRDWHRENRQDSAGNPEKPD